MNSQPFGHLFETFTFFERVRRRKKKDLQNNILSLRVSPSQVLTDAAFKVFCHLKSLTPTTAAGVNFINILCAAFMRADPKSAKKDSQVKQRFELLGSVCIKAAYEHVDEIDPCWCANVRKQLCKSDRTNLTSKRK